MKYFLTFLFIILFTITSTAQLTPEVTSWIINPGGQTGYAGIPSNIQQVQYSADSVYVSASCIPGYTIGPSWGNDPNIPVNQNFVYQLTRHPAANTGTPVATPLGHIGVWSNGVSIFNGQRTSFTNVTLDGINIQDTFIRTNAGDFSPNLLLLDQVAEMTIATSNSNPAAGGGASSATRRRSLQRAGSAPRRGPRSRPRTPGRSETSKR